MARVPVPELPAAVSGAGHVVQIAGCWPRGAAGCAGDGAAEAQTQRVLAGRGSTPKCRPSPHRSVRSSVCLPGGTLSMESTLLPPEAPWGQLALRAATRLSLHLPGPTGNAVDSVLPRRLPGGCHSFFVPPGARQVALWCPQCPGLREDRPAEAVRKAGRDRANLPHKSHKLTP